MKFSQYFNFDAKHDVNKSKEDDADDDEIGFESSGEESADMPSCVKYGYD
jgi:hypothetical protein